jgi:hypothetical protein
MGFGLLTALSVDDVPRMLIRVAHGYRGNVDRKHQHVWLRIADELDHFAVVLEAIIEQEKTHPPKAGRVRLEKAEPPKVGRVRLEKKTKRVKLIQ